MSEGPCGGNEFWFEMVEQAAKLAKNVVEKWAMSHHNIVFLQKKKIRIGKTFSDLCSTSHNMCSTSDEHEHRFNLNLFPNERNRNYLIFRSNEWWQMCFYISILFLPFKKYFRFYCRHTHTQRTHSWIVWRKLFLLFLPRIRKWPDFRAKFIDDSHSFMLIHHCSKSFCCFWFFHIFFRQINSSGRQAVILY